ncbi:MAG: ATPase, partial [Senegalia sp. (in: firmicutes)]
DSIKDADYCILVAEPTIFGSHNLKMVYDLVKLFNKAHGVVLNKYTNKDNPTEEFCNENNINILEKIYFDREIGNLNSDGQIISKLNDNYKAMFLSLLEKVAKEVEHEETINP